MINTEKVRLMAETVLYEESSKGESIRLRSYCETDARRFRLQCVVTGAVVYLLIAFVVFLIAGADFSIIRERPVAGAFIIAGIVLAGVVFTFFHTRIVSRVISTRYRNVRSSMVRYDLRKRKLRQIMREGKTETISAE